MPFTAAQIEEGERYQREYEESQRDLVRWLIESVKLWQHCEHRECRRMQRCVETQTCQKKYADDIIWWKREHLLPHLRERYPTVQWGAPASVVELQVEAALAAEADAKARREAGKAGKPSPRKRRRRKRVPRQPLYVPRDYAEGEG